MGFRARAGAILRRQLVPGAVLCVSMWIATGTRAAVPFVTPKPEELAMKSAPGFPGASAVVLYREELTRETDKAVDGIYKEEVGQAIPSTSFYYSRIKILNEDGKKYGTVEIFDYGRTNTVVEDVAGRTIHADGTIVPFTGKPYFKVVQQSAWNSFGSWSVQETEFTLPDVEVGSVIEYSYTTHEPRNQVQPPSWVIQDSLPVLLAHYEWLPTTEAVNRSFDTLYAVSWDPVLPAGVKVEHSATGYDGVFASKKEASFDRYSVTVKNVPPMEEGAFLPPVGMRRYGVRFSYATTVGDKFWSSEAKDWSKAQDKFLAANGDMRKTVEQLTAGASTQEEKARRIYAAVMEMENTDYTRAREKVEEKAEGNKDTVWTAGDLLQRKRGSSWQLAQLYIAMARAAGLEAYEMLVPDGSTEVFSPTWLSWSQFNAVLAIVKIDGKEVFLDPGTRYCPFAQLAWPHAQMEGLRQGPEGASLAKTPAGDFRANQMGRIANLTMGADGAVSGKIDLVYTGAEALRWRRVGLRDDEMEVRKRLTETLEKMLPESLKVEVTAVSNLTAYEQPLKVTATVTGTLGESTGKRRLLPADLFVTRGTTPFAEQMRELPVDFYYPETVQDAVRMMLPAGTTIEAAPDAAKLELPNRMVFDLGVTASATSFTTRRHMVRGVAYVPAAEYAGLRDFYSKVVTADQGNVVLKAAAQ